MELELRYLENRKSNLKVIKKVFKNLKAKEEFIRKGFRNNRIYLILA